MKDTVPFSDSMQQITAVSSDNALLSRIQNADMEEILAIAKECGFNLTEEDFKVTEENGKKGSTDELEAFSGGNDLNEDEAWADVHS